MFILKLSFLACAVGWSWEINYRFRVPHVDVLLSTPRPPIVNCLQQHLMEVPKVPDATKGGQQA